MAKRRRGRPRKTGPRYKSGQRQKREPNIGPTTEALLRRAEKVGSLQDALHPDAATYIGQLFRRGEINETEKQAGEIWAGYLHQYRALLEVPKQPKAAKLGESAGIERQDNPAYFRYIKASVDYCDGAVRKCGVMIYSATRGAVCDEPQRAVHHVKTGLAALWVALKIKK